jgi:hypothetical protein
MVIHMVVGVMCMVMMRMMVRHMVIVCAVNCCFFVSYFFFHKRLLSLMRLNFVCLSHHPSSSRLNAITAIPAIRP